MSLALQGKRACVVGRSNIVGLPVALLLQNADATVTTVHSRTPDAQSICCKADIVIAACGKTEMVKGDWIKEGAAVIDVGINSVEVSVTGPACLACFAAWCKYKASLCC
jgi:5,10-methylene-tetrahydrofolate dehydrogenase/methenyl tetrahydrofolate cyclohydrolase